MRISIVVVLLLVNALAAQSVVAQSSAKTGVSTGPEFTIGPRFVLMPEGFFILVRKGREIGAIRLTKIEEDAEGNGKSVYESYFQRDGSGSFLKSNVQKRTGQIDIKPMRGFHPFVWQPGQDKLWVGRWWFGCFTPRLVNMSTHFSEDDEGFEFAPTSAQTVAEIDASDKRLRWFRYVPDSRIRVPVSGLPK